MTKTILPVLILTISAVLGLQAQRSANETARAYLSAHSTQLGLSADDVADVKITDEYVSEHNKVTHVWLQQQYLGIPVYNGLLGLHVTPDGKVFHLDHRFVAGLSQKVNTTAPSLSAAKALEIALSGLDFDHPEIPRLSEKINERNLIFDKGSVSRSNIPVSACYFPLEKEAAVRLAWTMTIEPVNGSDMWSIRIDAQTGVLLERKNLTVYCSSHHLHHLSAQCNSGDRNPDCAPEAAPAAVVNGSYKVLALPVESPAHGSRSVVTNPANTTASPFGWHDIDGVAGNEFTYTRGNNVWAYLDLVSDNTGSVEESADGGANGVFDFPFDPNAGLDANKMAGIVNLFYMNNMMHDISYIYGFNEAAGNFQVNNYGKGGTGNDEVRAEGLDASGTDNAIFVTPAEGLRPRMQMYDWSRSGGNVVTVNAPQEIAGVYYGQSSSSWGGTISGTPITGDVVIGMSSGSGGGPLEGCDPLTNTNASGKIVMIDRGTCQFSLKALHAQEAGAKACIICNYEPTTIGMDPGAVATEVTIPVVMMSSINCAALRKFADQGLNISLVQPTLTGPDFLDGDFDNGIIAHEYTHGISNRLTGGPAITTCLSNPEQMGEGWSDFFALATTVKPGDLAEKRRGVGTYVLRQNNEGQGVRRFPYSTDMNINPLTFSAVAQNSGQHAIGEVWASMLWDLYWAMVDKYGYDANWLNTDSGNGRAIRLVMDGMKMQPCSPGFKDGRDAIMLADKLSFGGADTCLITTVFARRGLGIGASQGSSSNPTDGVESFAPIEICIKELKIKKTTSTPTIEAGGVAGFTITVTNHKDTEVTGVVVTDQVPQGLTAVQASTTGVVSGSTITWDLGTIAPGQNIVLTYAAQSDMSGSIRLYRDKMEDNADWIVGNTVGDVNFALQNTFKVTGNSAWKCNNLAKNMDATLTSAIPVFVTGNNPVFRFWNRFWLEQGNDAGFVQYGPTEQGPWTTFTKDKTFRNGYTGPVSYGTIAVPFLNGYTGNSTGWLHSYIDAKELLGTNTHLRFRFGSNSVDAFDGWYIDDLELLEMVNYDGEACISSAQGDQACVKAPGRGVVVNPATTDVPEVTENALELHIQPNPAHQTAYITVNKDITGQALLSVFSADGRLAAQRRVSNIQANEAIVVDAASLQAGIYTIRLESASGVLVDKLMVK